MGKVDLSVIGTTTEPVVYEYTWKDVVLYNIGVGADEKNLAFVYENTPGGLKVLPSFCVVPAMRAFPRLGDDLEWSLMLHGEQLIRLLQPLPPQGKIIQVGEVLNIYDKGKGAVYRIRIRGRTEDDKDLHVWICNPGHRQRTARWRGRPSERIQRPLFRCRISGR